MRKTKQQITNPQAVRDIVAKSEVLLVAFNDPEEGDNYIVPENYGFTSVNVHE